MIARLSGILIEKNSTEIVIDCAGVGYLVLVSLNTSDKLPDAGGKVSIYTLMVTREDSIQLFGFYHETEREVFKMLTSISGVGPKIALGILSSLTIEELQEYILSGNLPALQKLPGVGKKTAERIILELRDKITRIGLTEKPLAFGGQTLIRQEALSALVTLGYSANLAEKAIKKAMSEIQETDVTAELLIRKALRYAMA